jgi:hypothetical protein
VAKLEPEPPPLLTVIDLQGGCEHAAGFGQLDQLTLDQEWRLRSTRRSVRGATQATHPAKESRTFANVGGTAIARTGSP